MVCDETCLVAVANRVPTIEPLIVPQLDTCCTCYACSFTLPGTRCPCTALEVSCSGPSWLLTTQAADAVDAIYEAVGPIELTDSDWQQLTGWGEQHWVGGLVGLLWVREQQPGSDR